MPSTIEICPQQVTLELLECLRRNLVVWTNRPLESPIYPGKCTSSPHSPGKVDPFDSGRLGPSRKTLLQSFQQPLRIGQLWVSAQCLTVVIGRLLPLAGSFRCLAGH